MIEVEHLVEWKNVAPWHDFRQIEMDLIISKAIISMFKDPFLCRELRMRGGTALNKLHFPYPIRYSEDIDLVRTELGPIGPSIDHLRAALEPWLGKANFSPSPVASRLRFRIPIDDENNSNMRLKIEINTSEVEPFEPPIAVRYKVYNTWFSDFVDVPTYSREEMMSSKLRALLQRDKGRDLFDLAHGLVVFDGLVVDQIIESFLFYLQQSGKTISRAEAETRMFAKLAGGRLLDDILPILSSSDSINYTDKRLKNDFATVFSKLITQIPGKPWKRTEEKIEKFGIELH